MGRDEKPRASRVLREEMEPWEERRDERAIKWLVVIDGLRRRKKIRSVKRSRKRL